MRTAWSIIVAVTVAMMAIAAYHRRRAAQSGEVFHRKQNEGATLMIAIRLLGLALLTATLLWIFQPQTVAWADLPIPPTIRQLGAALYTLSALWMIWMYRTLDRNLTDTVETRRNATLIQHGPYRYVRHPMYTGLLAITLSLGIAQANALVPACGIVLFALLARRARTEEQFLIAKFGDAYRDYQKRVRPYF